MTGLFSISQGTVANCKRTAKGSQMKVALSGRTITEARILPRAISQSPYDLLVRQGRRSTLETPRLFSTMIAQSGGTAQAGSASSMNKEGVASKVMTTNAVTTFCRGWVRDMANMVKTAKISTKAMSHGMALFKHARRGGHGVIWNANDFHARQLACIHSLLEAN